MWVFNKASSNSPNHSTACEKKLKGPYSPSETTDPLLRVSHLNFKLWPVKHLPHTWRAVPSGASWVSWHQPCPHTYKTQANTSDHLCFLLVHQKCHVHDYKSWKEEEPLFAELHVLHDAVNVVVILLVLDAYILAIGKGRLGRHLVKQYLSFFSQALQGTLWKTMRDSIHRKRGNFSMWIFSVDFFLVCKVLMPVTLKKIAFTSHIFDKTENVYLV